MSGLDTLSAQMQQLGISPPTAFSVDGKLHRFGERKSKQNGWYILRWFRLDSGTEVLVGTFGDWKLYQDQAFKVDWDLPPFSEEETKKFKAEQARIRKVQAEERAAKHQEAAQRAEKIWAKLPVEGHSGYLQRKQVAGVGVRYSRGSVVVPLRRIDTSALMGLQFIREDGSKLFLTGTAKEGAGHVLGELEGAEAAFVAEGYATAASVYMAVQRPVVCAFDAGNLLPVGKALRAQYPHLKLIFAADNDEQTPSNPGVTKATAAAKAVGGKVVIPLQTAAPAPVIKVGA